jgi:hypothetical protein
MKENELTSTSDKDWHENFQYKVVRHFLFAQGASSDTLGKYFLFPPSSLYLLQTRTALGVLIRKLVVGISLEDKCAKNDFDMLHGFEMLLPSKYRALILYVRMHTGHLCELQGLLENCPKIKDVDIYLTAEKQTLAALLEYAHEVAVSVNDREIHAEASSTNERKITVTLIGSLRQSKKGARAAELIEKIHSLPTNIRFLSDSGVWKFEMGKAPKKKAQAFAHAIANSTFFNSNHRVTFTKKKTLIMARNEKRA